MDAGTRGPSSVNWSARCIFFRRCSNSVDEGRRGALCRQHSYNKEKNRKKNLGGRWAGAQSGLLGDLPFVHHCTAHHAPINPTQPTLSSLARGGGQPGGMGRRRRCTPTAKMTCRGESSSSHACRPVSSSQRSTPARQRAGKVSRCQKGTDPFLGGAAVWWSMLPANQESRSPVLCAAPSPKPNTSQRSVICPACMAAGEWHRQFDCTESSKGMQAAGSRRRGTPTFRRHVCGCTQCSRLHICMEGHVWWAETIRCPAHQQTMAR